jgi:hypothetical protein
LLFCSLKTHRDYMDLSISATPAISERDSNGGFIYGQKGKDKSDLGNDSELDREKNNVTGVKTSDQLHDHSITNDTRGQRSPKRGEKDNAV